MRRLFDGPSISSKEIDIKKVIMSFNNDPQSLDLKPLNTTDFEVLPHISFYNVFSCQEKNIRGDFCVAQPVKASF